jgi:CBS domain-containing protein
MRGQNRACRSSHRNARRRQYRERLSRAAAAVTKRLPVIDGDRLVGIITEKEVAEYASPEQVVAIVRGVYANG